MQNESGRNSLMPEFRNFSGKRQATGKQRATVRHLPALIAVIFVLAFFVLPFVRPNSTFAVSFDQPTATTVRTTVNPTRNEGGSVRADNLARTPSIWPVTGVVTSSFGWRKSPFEGDKELHSGIDIAVHLGAPVVATADGKVVQSGQSGGYGNLVQLDHGNGIATLYGHNSRLAVQVGETVKKGQVISYAGSTGRSTGPHVHYEIRKNDTAIDPWTYLVVYKSARKS